jgi:uncharacterized HAD superfamily protein
MPVKEYETIYQTAARSGFPVAHIIDFLKQNKMVFMQKGNDELYSITQMNWLMKQSVKENHYKDFSNHQKAEVIEIFFATKDNTLVNIVKVTGVPYHRVYKLIDRHMKDLADFKNSASSAHFITLESSINEL